MANENIYHPVRFNLGKPPKYTPEQLAKEFEKYVQWCKDNPIVIVHTTESTSVDGRKYGSHDKDEKPRLVSISGFLVHLGLTDRYWKELDNSKKYDYSKVKDIIRKFCEDYQKEMASAGIFNGNIISRLLGLADKQQVESRTESRIIVENEEQAEKLRNIRDLG